MVATDGTLGIVWQQAGIACVIVPASTGVEVQLLNAQGVAFLRKSAPGVEAARNEAEYFRLLLESGNMPGERGPLKPFALVAQGDVESCDVFAEALKSVGVRTLGVNRGADAIRLARILAPDLIVVDHRLPDISGAEVCRQLRNDPVAEPLPVIAVTDAPDTLRAEGCLADAVLAKPCRLDTFLAAARLFLRQTSRPPSRADAP